MTVSRLLAELGSREMTEWQAFAQLEPFGGAVDDLRAGLGPALTVNMNRTEGTEPIGPMQFYPWYDAKAPEPEPQTPEELAAALRALLTSKAKPDGN